MPHEQVVKRIIALEARINLHRLFQNHLQDHEWLVYNEALKQLQETSLTIIDKAFLTPSQLHVECLRLSTEIGVDLIVIDGLELIHPERVYHDLEQETHEIARLSKNLARELNVPVLITSQLDRSPERRQDKRPMLGDVPGNLDQFADVIMFLYRDEYYHPDTTERPNIAELFIAKHRNGPTGYVDLYWHPQLATFRNLVRTEISL